MSKQNKTKLKLDDNSVFAFIGYSSKSVILEVITEDQEAIDLTYKALIKWLTDMGLTKGE